MHGHLDALIFLLQCDWSEYDGQLTKVEAMQQAMVASAATGHTNVSAWRFVSKKSSDMFKKWYTELKMDVLYFVFVDIYIFDKLFADYWLPYA